MPGRKFLPGSLAYTGALRILKVIMSYEYLWTNIRVKGGAYGCMAGFGRGGNSYFVSYRDPHLAGTNRVFEGIPAYVREFTVDDRDMTKYVIGTVNEMDTPLTPSMEGELSLVSWMNNISPEDYQRERDQVLDACQEDIRALAPTWKRFWIRARSASSAARKNWPPRRSCLTRSSH